MNILQHYNLQSEPRFRLKKPCEGCGVPTKLNLIEIECWECHGDGWVEDEEDYTNRYYTRTCWGCNGVGTYKIWLRYCCDECYEYHNYELD